MKKLGTVAATLAALMMAAAPAVAAAPQSPASKLSVVNAKRAGAPVTAANQAAGGSIIWIGLAAVAVIVGIILIADDDDEPASP